MKVLLYSSVFPPSVGGVETIAVTLATKIAQKGHECCVVTETPSDEDDSVHPFAVHRAPSRRERWRLVRECSIVHANGASVAMYPYARLAGKPFMWTHNGYQAICIDGLGWAYGKPAPMTPWRSIAHHMRRGDILFACREGIKLLVRRWISKRVDMNVACTDWVAKRLALPRQVVAYTPYPLGRFRNQRIATDHENDFIYVGRLVSEKGVDDLISAMALHCGDPQFAGSKLVIVGDGPLRTQLERQAIELGIERNMSFLGAKRGDDLLAAIRTARVGIVPSRWEEAMGGVALELLASGRTLIVSERGGHAECVRGAAMTFPNGNVESLRDCMDRVLCDPAPEADDLLVDEILRRFDEGALAAKYIQLYASLTRSRSSKVRELESKQLCPPAT
jgi:glycosyltransferase involved in cell wall biosynthesis